MLEKARTDVEQGHRLRPGPELVPGFLADSDEVAPMAVHIRGPKLALDSINDGFPAGMEAELFHDGQFSRNMDYIIKTS